MGYNLKMNRIVQSDLYAEWFAKLRDAKARAIINARLRRLELGNAGDCEPVGEGVSEMRIHHGPGYRLYFVKRGLALVVLLAGGTKATQTKDIKEALKEALKLARTL